jgi:ABC-type molybdate transport system substrate-binding protein
MRDGGRMKYKRASAMMALLLTGAPGMAAEISVMSGGPPKEALAILIPRFKKLTGHDVKMTYAVIAALCSKNSAGETPDMVLLPTSVIADLAKTGTLKSEGSRPFGTIRIVAITRTVFLTRIFPRRKRSTTRSSPLVQLQRRNADSC